MTQVKQRPASMELHIVSPELPELRTKVRRITAGNLIRIDEETESLAYLDPFGLLAASSGVVEPLVNRSRGEGVGSDETPRLD